MRNLARNVLIATGAAALATAATAPATAQVVLTPEQRVVVYQDLVTYPYPAPAYYYSPGYVYTAPVPQPQAYVYQPAPRWRVAVGAVVPREVVLQPVPETVRVPGVAGYSYAVIDDRVVIAEPESREVFQVLYEDSQ